MKIANDSGHGVGTYGGFDPGAVGSASLEADNNQLIANSFESSLKARGIEVVNLGGYPLVKRPGIANSAGVAAGISWHCNASNDSNVRGVSLHVQSKTCKGYALAQKLESRLAPVLQKYGMPYRGIVIQNLEMTRETIAPWVLIEDGFITNYVDQSLQTIFGTHSQYINDIASTVADGVIDYLGVAPTPAPAPTPQPRPTPGPQRVSLGLTRRIKRGVKGEDVRHVQKRLIELGYSCGKWGADGVDGNDTTSAILRYQKDHGLPADGEVWPGYPTQKALEEGR